MNVMLWKLPGIKLKFHVKHIEGAAPMHQLLVVAGGRAPQQQWLQQVAAGRQIYCADRGAAYALAAQLRPRAVFGDGDSAEATVYEQAEALGAELRNFPPAKDDTDLQLLLSQLPAGDILASGIWGGRFDHLYSNVFTLLGLKQQRQCQVVLADEQELLVLLKATEAVTLELEQPAKAVSLLALGAQAKASISGVRWPLQQAPLRQLYPYSISNEALSGQSLECCCHSGALGLYICWRE